MYYKAGVLARHSLSFCLSGNILNFDKDNKETHIIPNIDYSNILKEFKK